MKLDDLKALRVGDRVMCRVRVKGDDRVGLGRVHAIDHSAIEIFWNDQTSSVLWLDHCADGRDNRHEIIFPYTRGRAAA